MAHDHPTGLKRWLFTTNHKDIGTMYLVFAFTMALIGGSMSLVIRAELFQPGLQIVEPHFFNQMTTVHALVMIFRLGIVFTEDKLDFAPPVGQIFNLKKP